MQLSMTNPLRSAIANYASSWLMQGEKPQINSAPQIALPSDISHHLKNPAELYDYLVLRNTIVPYDDITMAHDRRRLNGTGGTDAERYLALYEIACKHLAPPTDQNEFVENVYLLSAILYEQVLAKKKEFEARQTVTGSDSRESRNTSGLEPLLN